MDMCTDINIQLVNIKISLSFVRHPKIIENTTFQVFYVINEGICFLKIILFLHFYWLRKYTKWNNVKFYLMSWKKFYITFSCLISNIASLQ